MTRDLSKMIKEEIDDLVNIGERLSTFAESSGSSPKQDTVITASTWVARIGQIIRKLYSPNSQHFVNYESALATKNFYNMHSNWCSHVFVMTGIIKAIQHEFDKGLLADFRRLVQVDIFADFLQMGEYLLGEHYKDAAAVIIGSVLEDTLRQIAGSNGLATVGSTGKRLTIEPLNNELAKAGIYDRLIQKQITSWGELRNRAAHGQYDKYDEQQVNLMLLFVQKFCSDYLR